MLKNPDYITARRLLLETISTVGTEKLALCESGGRILAQDLVAEENIPPFDRSPYDGYAFRAADTEKASRETPVTLCILEEVPTGAVPTVPVTEGTAVKLLTGAPIPTGADTVIPYELTDFTDTAVTVFAPAKPGDNVVRTGEDVRKGKLLAHRGDVIDPGTAGTLASQGIAEPEVYRMPKVGILSTGSELVEVAETPGPGSGKIRNSNRYTFEAVLKALGCETVYLGIAGDSAEEICTLLQKGLAECDAVITTGGVSVGDYDLTPEAMEMAGVELLFRGVDIKPGMACVYGVCQGKPVFGLSGNPASSLTNFYVVGVPALRKMMGYREPLMPKIKVTLSSGFGKKSPKARFLRGTLELKDGTVRMALPKEQGNVVLSSAIGCNVMAVIPAGSGPVPAGTELEGFLL